MSQIKNIFSLVLSLLLFANCQKTPPPLQQQIITADIDNFWLAYDKIVTTKDSAQQHQYLKELFLDKGTPGLASIMQVRNYTAQSYLDAINQYPKFWASIRPNMLKAKGFAKEIEAGVQQLKNIYPELRPANVYFSVGAFRTPGTTLDSLVLIGSELAMGDEHINSTEFPASLDYVKQYFASNPIQSLVFLNVHEFVHTQQIATIGDNLLMQCFYEGIAEFVTVKATGQVSPTAAISYGKKHDEKVKERFTKEMFSLYYDNWLWNDLNNDFQTRDLGYYIGYAISEKYYDAATDKQQAIKDLVELNFKEAKTIEQFVDQTGYFNNSIAELRKRYEQNKPHIVSIKEFTNGDQNVSPNLRKITIEFSTKMNTRTRGFDLGPLGVKNVLRVQNFLGFSDDGKSIQIEVELKPKQQYQLLLSDKFQNEYGVRITPYLIDIKTK